MCIIFVYTIYMMGSCGLNNFFEFLHNFHSFNGRFMTIDFSVETLCKDCIHVNDKEVFFNITKHFTLKK